MKKKQVDLKTFKFEVFLSEKYIHIKLQMVIKYNKNLLTIELELKIYYITEKRRIKVTDQG